MKKFLSFLTSKNILVEICSFLQPIQFVLVIKNLFPLHKSNHMIGEYLQKYLYSNSNHIINLILEKNPNQIDLLLRTIFLPIHGYTCNITADYIFCNGQYIFQTIDQRFYESFDETKTLFVLGVVYYRTNARKFFNLLKEFKVPKLSQKNKFINQNGKILKLLYEHGYKFSDFQYYSFRRDQSEYFTRKIKKENPFIHQHQGLMNNRFFNFFRTNPPLNYRNRLRNFDCFQFINEVTARFVLKKLVFCYLNKDITFSVFYSRNYIKTKKKKRTLCEILSIDGDDSENFQDNSSIAEEEPKSGFFDYRLNSNYLEIDNSFVEKHIYYSNKLSTTQIKNDVTIEEFFDENLFEECKNHSELKLIHILTLKTNKNLDFFEYNLKHFRLGKAFVVAFNTNYEGEKSHIIPKVLPFGTLVNL